MMLEAIIFTMTKIIRLIGALFILLPSLGHADSLRCGQTLVEVGENKAELLDKCGRPQLTDSFCRNVVLPGRNDYTVYCDRIEVWTYNFGPGSFLMNVEFKEGRITDITHGDRVN